jgi:hypothetical protein
MLAMETAGGAVVGVQTRLGRWVPNMYSECGARQGKPTRKNRRN